jgi:plastocyanin
MRIFRLSLSLFTILLAFVAAGCAAGPEKVEYSIEMTDFAFTPNTLDLKVGQEVTLHLTNAGALKHELMVGRGVVMENGLATGYEEDMFADTEPVVHVGDEHEGGDHSNTTEHGHASDQFMVTVPENAGEATVTFVVTEEMVGEWEMGCFLDSGSHLQQGMTGKVVVTP